MELSKKQSTDVIVGAFVVLGAVAIIGATMWAREDHLGRRGAVMVARFREIGGVGVGSNAYIRGVRAGRVSAIELTENDWVHVRIALDPSVRLPQDPVILLGPSGLVGEWHATIVSRDAAPPDAHVQRQLADAEGARGIVPGATMPDVKQVTAGAGRILDDFGLVAHRASAVFDDSAAKEMRRAITNAADITAELAASSKAVRRAALRADSASAGGGLQNAIRDISGTAIDLRAMAAELRSFTARGSESRTTLDRVLARMDTLVGRTTAGQGTLDHVVRDPSLYANADSLLMELRALVADVKANPRRYVNIRIF